MCLHSTTCERGRAIWFTRANTRNNRTQPLSVRTCPAIECTVIFLVQYGNIHLYGDCTVSNRASIINKMRFAITA